MRTGIRAQTAARGYRRNRSLAPSLRPVSTTRQRHEDRGGSEESDSAQRWLQERIGHISAGLAGLFAAGFGTTSFVAIEPVDGVYRAILVWTVALLVTRSRRRRQLFPLVLGAMTGATIWLQLLSMTALVVAIREAVTLRHRPHRNRLAPAASGAVVGFQLAFLPVDLVGRLSGGSFQLSSAITAFALFYVTLPAARSGWKRSSRRRRRKVRRYVLVGCAALVAIIAFVGFAALSARRPVIDAVAFSQAAQVSLGEGDIAAARDSLQQSHMAWSQAARTMTWPGIGVGRLVPFVGPHVELSQVATLHAAAVTEAANVVATRYDDDLFDEGSLNVRQLESLLPAVQSLEGTLVSADVAFNRIATRPLLPPLRDPLARVQTLLGTGASTATTGTLLLELATTLTGSQSNDGAADILVMFSTPAEARGFGGFVGNWAHLRSDQGRLELVEHYRSNDLNAALSGVTEDQLWDRIGDVETEDRYRRYELTDHVQDVTLSPHGPTVSRLATELFSLATDIDVEAVVIVDPFVLETLVSYSGAIEFGSTTLRAGSVAELLLRGQYLEFADDDDAREAVLAEVTGELLEALIDQPPNLVSFARDMHLHVDAGRLAIWVPTDRNQVSPAALLGLDGGFATSDDVLAIVHQNAGQNKIDAYLHRRVTLQSSVSAHGHVRHRLTVDLDNSAPSTGLPDAVIASNDQGLPLGTNRSVLTLYSPLPNIVVTQDGAEVAVQTERELGQFAHSVLLHIGPESETQLGITLEGNIDTSADGNDAYSLLLPVRPLANPDHWDASITFATHVEEVSPPPGWSVVTTGDSSGRLDWAGPVTSDALVVIG